MVIAKQMKWEIQWLARYAIIVHVEKEQVWEIAQLPSSERISRKPASGRQPCMQGKRSK
jgi:hypothetical protein